MKAEVATPRRERSRVRYEERRRAVVAVAARLFAERGYAETSIDDLVAATGLQRGGLYHYIESKQHLLLLVHEELMEPLLAEAEEIVGGAGGPDEKLRLLLRAWVAHVARHRDHMVVFNESRRVIERDPAWNAVRADRDRFQGLLERVLVEGTRAGAFVVPDVRLVELSILGVVNYMPQWLDPRGRLAPEEIADGCVDLLLAGLVPRPA